MSLRAHRGQRRDLATRRRRCATAGALAVAALLGPELTPAAAAEPRTVTVVVGNELTRHLPRDVDLSAVSLRFFPEDVEVRRGDVIRFVSNVRLQTIALLPPAVTEPDRWIEEHAFHLEDSWYPVTLDRDERGVKVANAVAFPPFPPCGEPGQRPCTFPMAAQDAVVQSTRWGFARPSNDPQRLGVLGSGLRPAPPSSDTEDPPITLDFSVRVDAAPGTTLHVVSLFAKQGKGRIVVVPDEAPVPTQDELDEARVAQLDEDAQMALALDRRYSDHRVALPGRDGAFAWEALAGVEEGPVALRQAYPRRLELEPGETVAWSTRLVESLVHTVTFPGAALADVPIFTPQCDMDTDAGVLDDLAAPFERPLFCPTGPTAVEFDLNRFIGPRLGDGTFYDAADLDSSGVLGMAPDLVGEPGYSDVHPREDYHLTFAKPSGPAGYDYWCALHGEMNATVVVQDAAGEPRYRDLP